MQINDEKYDQKIIAALKALPVPLMSFDGHKILFNLNKRKETIFEHIAKKTHHIYIVDVKNIPSILNNALSLKNDRKGKRYRTYIGRRGKKNERLKYLKIVTEITKNGTETIITIYPVKTNC
jgi:hypothetical protein